RGQFLLAQITPNRVWNLTRLRYKFVLWGGGISAFVSMMIGLTTPYLYRSSAYVQIALPPQRDSAVLDPNDVERISNLVRSPVLLTRVATDIINGKRISLRSLVPQSVSTTNLKERKNIFIEHFVGHPMAWGNSNENASPEILA